MRTISVLIPDAEDPLTLRVMRSLGTVPGVAVDLMTSDPRASARLSRFCRRRHVTACSLIDAGRSDALVHALTHHPVDVLLPVSVAGARLVAAQRQRLARHAALPPLPDPAAMNLADDKANLCRFALTHDVPTPPFLVYPDQVPDLSVLGRLSYPVVLKPPSWASGRGIQLFRDQPTLARFLAAGQSVRHGGRYLLQSYMPGADLGLNVLCRDGQILAFTVQQNTISSAPPFGPVAAARFVRDPQPLEIGRRLLAAMRWNGVANLDMRRCADTGQTLLLEMNPRYWRSLPGSVYAGVNFPYLACLVALGQPITPTGHRLTAYADTRVAVWHALGLIVGRSPLKGLRLRNTDLRAAMTDPLPAFADCIKKLRSPKVKVASIRPVSPGA